MTVSLSLCKLLQYYRPIQDKNDAPLPIIFTVAFSHLVDHLSTRGGGGGGWVQTGGEKVGNGLVSLSWSTVSNLSGLAGARVGLGVGDLVGDLVGDDDVVGDAVKSSSNSGGRV